MMPSRVLFHCTTGFTGCAGALAAVESSAQVSSILVVMTCSTPADAVWIADEFLRARGVVSRLPPSRFRRNLGEDAGLATGFHAFISVRSRRTATHGAEQGRGCRGEGR